MATTTQLPAGFKEFLRLLNSKKVEYLLENLPQRVGSPRDGYVNLRRSAPSKACQRKDLSAVLATQQSVSRRFCTPNRRRRVNTGFSRQLAKHSCRAKPS